MINKGYHCAAARTPGINCMKGKSEDTNASSWLSGLSIEEIRKAQLQDPCLAPVITLKERSSDRPPWEEVSHESPIFKSYWAQWPLLAVRDCVLYRKWESDRGNEATWKLVIPKGLRQDVLKQLHNSPTTGHLGMKKTTDRVMARFYWRGLRKDVKLWCTQCDVCASHKMPCKSPRAPMKTYNIGAPMERIAIDVMGPLPTTDRDNKCILVVSDYFTKWTEVYPMPNQEAGTVADIVVREFISRFGLPRQLHTDQGRNFESRLFQEMCKILEIEKTRTTPLRPQSDGMVERFNRTLEAMLSKFVQESQKDWDLYLPLLMLAYRSSVHESTGFTPNEMMLGREVLLPVDLLIGRLEPAEDNSETEYAARLSEQIELVHHFARQHLKICSDRQKKNYDHRPVNQFQYQRGDPVWLYTPQRKKGICPKLMRCFDGPYLVIKRISDLVYRIQKGPKSKPKVVHHDPLKAYRGSNPPNWLTENDGSQHQAQTPAAKEQTRVTPLIPEMPLPVPGNSEDLLRRKSDCVPAADCRRPRRDVENPVWMKDYQTDNK